MTESKVIAHDMSTITEIRPYLSLSGIIPLTSSNLKRYVFVFYVYLILKYLTSHFLSKFLELESLSET